jgi:Fe-S cluster assembly protein SufD
VSKADDEKIFYAMSRGLSEEEARNIIIEGFFENLLQVIQDPQWYEKLKGLIEAKLFISPSHE